MMLLQQEPSAQAAWTRIIVVAWGNSPNMAGCPGEFTATGATICARADSMKAPWRAAPRDATVNALRKLRRSISSSWIQSSFALSLTHRRSDRGVRSQGGHRLAVLSAAGRTRPLAAKNVFI